MSVVNVNDTGPVQYGTDADTAKSLYGYLGWFVDHPVIGPIILQAAQEQWDIGRLQGALAKTSWWKKTSETARRWDALVASDPATAERRRDETSVSIGLLAARLGMRLGNQRLSEISQSATRFGWNEQEIQLALAAEMKFNPHENEGGIMGKYMATVKALAAQYMVPINEQQAWQWSRRLVSGASTIEAVQAQFTSLAKARFPQLSKEIDQGVTPGDFFTPYRNAIAEQLEVAPEAVNLMDSKWAPVVSFRSEKRGELRPMTVSEATRFARMQPGWGNTENAKETVAQASQAMLDMFGAA